MVLEVSFAACPRAEGVGGDDGEADGLRVSVADNLGVAIYATMRDSGVPRTGFDVSFSVILVIAAVAVSKSTGGVVEEDALPGISACIRLV